MVDVMSEVTGFLGDGSVILTCEVHGYASFSMPPTWTSTADLTNTSKFVINVSNSNSRSLINSDGSVRQGIVISLTINDLRLEDESNFTCDVGDAASTTWLKVVRDTEPPVTTTMQLTTKQHTNPIFTTSGTLAEGTYVIKCT